MCDDSDEYGTVHLHSAHEPKPTAAMRRNKNCRLNTRLERRKASVLTSGTTARGRSTANPVNTSRAASEAGSPWAFPSIPSSGRTSAPRQVISERPEGRGPPALCCFSLSRSAVDMTHTSAEAPSSFINKHEFGGDGGDAWGSITRSFDTANGGAHPCTQHTLILEIVPHWGGDLFEDRGFNLGSVQWSTPPLCAQPTKQRRRGTAARKRTH